MPETKRSELHCEFHYPDGEACGDPVVAHCMCRRHYAQHTRGRLGKTKEIASPGVNVKPTISVTINIDTLEKLDKRAKRLGQSRSETVEEILTTQLG